MMKSDRTGKIQTVLGLIPSDELGITHTHEHLLIDGSVLDIPPSEAGTKGLYYKPVSLNTLSDIHHHAIRNLDNSLVIDIETAIEEILLYKQYGGNSVVDATSIGLGRDPKGLAYISRATGINIIMGSSYYIYPSHPPDMDNISEDQIMENIVDDINKGVDDTDIRSGIIGEIGCTWPPQQNEIKVLRASGKAQKVTGAPILIHPGRNENAPLTHLNELKNLGLNLAHTIMGHIERTVFSRDILREIADTGCFIEWDMIGQEQSFYYENQTIDMPNHGTRMDDMLWLIDQGYGNQILLGHDIAEKYRLVRYGGHGYSYILKNILPRMRKRGFTKDSIYNILVNNPKRALAFREHSS